MRNKKLRVLLIILSVIGIVVGGFTMHEHQEKQKMIKIATSKEAKKIYENNMKELDKKALNKGVIKSYKIDTETLEYNPMGGLMLDTIINGNKELTMDFNLLDNGDGTYITAYYGFSTKLSKLLGHY